MRFLIILLLFITSQLTGFCPIAYSQQAEATFGKNRIQKKDFNWRYLSSFNFDIYYYDGGEDLARSAAHYAEADYRKIEDRIGFSPYTKIKLLIYNSVEDLQQSNIGLEDQDPVIGGQTNFVKSKIEVAFTGSQTELRKDIRFSIAEMIINIMLYGGTLKDIVQNSYLLSLPDWYVKGAAAYISKGWSEEMDNYMRELFLSGEVKKPSHLTGEKSVFAGQSIWNFIYEKYGKSNMGSVLNLTRVMRNEESSIESTLGVPYSVFIKEWKSFYTSMAGEARKSYEEVPDELKIEKNKKGRSITNIQYSPDGNFISYIESYKGKFKLKLYNTSQKKTKTIYKTGHRIIHSKEDPLHITHAWHNEQRIAFIEKSNGKSHLVFMELPSGKKVRKPIKDFTQILSFSFSPDGNTIVLSADKGGQSDIFIYDFKNNSYKQITNDLFDDLDPVFLKNSNQIAFSSNRYSDSLSVTQGIYQASLNNFNIFIYNSSFKKDVLIRVTEENNNYKPSYLEGEKLLYLSDETGIRNLVEYDLKTGNSKQISKFLYSIKSYSYAPQAGLALVSLRKNKEVPYEIKGFKPQDISSTATTERRRLLEGANPVTKKIIDTSAFYFDSTPEKEVEFNINNFTFESDVKRQKEKERANFAKTAAKQDEISLKGPSPYRNLFGVERVNSTIMIDPLRGLGVLMEGQMADMMGNHRIKAGIFGLTDLKSSSVWGEYWFLKKRVDMGVRYDRKTIYSYKETVGQRYILNRGALTFSYPLTTNMRISASPFIATTRYTDLNTYAIPDHVVEYKGLKTELVFDNTIVKGMNMIEGTRFRVSAEQFNGDNKYQNFGKFTFDLRHYQPIHKEILFAIRLSYGQFYGNAKKNFLLGGMDNWLFNSTVNQGPGDPLNITLNQDNSDLLFVDYVTNMRGFAYNAQYGPKYVLFNGELRVPVFRYLYNGVIHSNFLKNFQLVGFTDIGSAWSGTSPFNRDNSTNTTFVGGGSNPFSAKVVNYKSPFLVGYGAGVRTLFLGYYMKFDVAWGLVNYHVENRRIYLTLGYDF